MHQRWLQALIKMCDQLRSNTSEDFENVDTPVIYVSKFDEYGLKIMDGGSSYFVISYCPWCGEKLPESKRDRWFDELESLGIEHPLTDEVPKKYQSDEWYR